MSCAECGDYPRALCARCSCCGDCCACGPTGALLDADELGLDPEHDDERAYPDRTQYHVHIEPKVL